MRSKKVLSLVGLSLLLAALLFVPALGAEGPDSREVARLLSDARTASVLVSRAAAEMDRYPFAGLNWATHSLKLEELKELVNTLSSTLNQLERRRSEAAPEQRVAIDRLIRAHNGVARNVEATIRHLLDNRQDIEAEVRSCAEYKDFLRDNFVLAEELEAQGRRI